MAMYYNLCSKLVFLKIKLNHTYISSYSKLDDMFTQFLEYITMASLVISKNHY